MGREEVEVKTILTSDTASPHCRLSSPPPFPYTRRCRRSITYVSRSRSPAPKAFLATAFLTLGHGDTTWFYWNGMIRGLGNGAAVHEHGMWHGFLHIIKIPEV